MNDRPHKGALEDRKAGSKGKTDVVERRSARRQPFIAEAQVIELKTGAKLLARSCDLVVHGCYIDTLNSFPIGTRVRIQLKKDDTTVEANGHVVYGIPGLGMGIAFDNLTPSNRVALERWLAGIKIGGEAFDALLPPIAFSEPAAIRQEPAGQMVDLIRMLKQKGILSELEAVGLLKGPLNE